MRRSALMTVLVAAACGAPDQTGGIPASYEASSDGPPALATVDRGEVVDFAGPDGSAFSVAARTSELTQYPCASCHEGPVTRGERGEEEHADVQPVHPEALASECATCHSAADPSHLILQTGETASLDEAYRLCAQCHFQEGDAWAGGGHGKRLLGWRGERVVMSCTGCHDPHDPTFEKQIPFRGPNIPRTGRVQR